METQFHGGLEYFAGWAGLELYFYCHRPAGPSKAIVILVHGYAEHSGRYAHVIDFFVEQNYTVYAYDQRGHGRSEGVRADVVKFNDHVKDLKTFVDLVRERESSDRIFLLGHSTGAVISVLLAAQHAELLAGLISTSIYLRDARQIPAFLIAVAPIVAAFAPLLPVSESVAEYVSKDPEVVENARTDPLTYHGKVRARMGVHFLNMYKDVTTNMGNVVAPILILNGADDRLADPEGSKILFEGIGSKDKTLRVFDGVHHEILNEPEKQMVFDEIADWLSTRI